MRPVPDSNASDEYIEEMLSEASGNINFTLFLTLMGERMSGTGGQHMRRKITSRPVH